MSKAAIPSSILVIAIVVLFAVVREFSVTFFEDSRAVAAQFQEHKQLEGRAIGELKAHDQLVDEQMREVKSSLLELRTDVKEILRNVKRQ